MKAMTMIFLIMTLGVVAIEKFGADHYMTKAMSYKTWDYENETWGDWQKPDKVKYEVEITNDVEGVILIKSQPVQSFYFKSRTLGHMDSSNATYDKYECKDSEGNEVLIKLYRFDDVYALYINDFSNALVGMYTMVEQ